MFYFHCLKWLSKAIEETISKLEADCYFYYVELVCYYSIFLLYL